MRVGASSCRIFWVTTFWDALAGTVKGPTKCPSVSTLYRSWAVEDDGPNEVLYTCPKRADPAEHTD